MRRRVPVLSGAALAVLVAMRPAGGGNVERQIKAIAETPAGLPWWLIAAAVAAPVPVGIAIVVVRRSRRRDHWTELKR